MRGWLFLLLALLIGGGVYIGLWLMDYVPFFISRDVVFKKAGEGVLAAQGFPPAKTPSEALEKFTTAVKERNYKAAGSYCAGDYGEQLKRAHSAANTVGTEVDKLLNLMKERKLETDRVRLLLGRLDPFPSTFKGKDVQKQPDGKFLGAFQLEPALILLVQANLSTEPVDPKVLQCVLMPPMIYTPPGVVEIVSEGQGNDKQWKLNFPLIPEQRDAISHFLEKHENYVDRLGYLNQEARKNRFSEPREFENEVLRALKDAR